ncbi:MAG: TolC family protein [Nitrospirae bacterium]|nr:TolC family protein [Nitrospirota bacterium]
MNRAFYLTLAAIAVFIFQTGAYAADSTKKLSLPEGLRIAASESRVVKIASYNKEISGAGIVLARSRFMPNVNAFAGKTYLSYQPAALMGGQPVYMSEKNYASYGINAYQTLFDFGQNSSQIEISKNTHTLSSLELKKIKSLAALDFLSAYFDTLEAEKIINTSKKEMERLQAHQTAAKNLFDEGVITKNDLLQAEVRLADARQRSLSANTTREIFLMRLNNILSFQMTDGIEVEEYDREPGVGTDLNRLWDYALSNRVELLIIDKEIKSAELEESSLRSDYFPKFFAQGGYNYTENSYQQHDANWSVILGLNMNLFGGMSTEASVSKAKYRTAQLREKKKQISDEIKLQVKQAFLEAATSYEKLTVSKNAFEQAEENLRINKVRYAEGIGTATEVLDAISLLTITETNNFKTRYELRKAQAALLYAAGHDLVSEYQ